MATLDSGCSYERLANETAREGISCASNASDFSSALFLSSSCSSSSSSSPSSSVITVVVAVVVVLQSEDDPKRVSFKWKHSFVVVFGELRAGAHRVVPGVKTTRKSKRLDRVVQRAISARICQIAFQRQAFKWPNENEENRKRVQSRNHSPPVMEHELECGIFCAEFAAYSCLHSNSKLTLVSTQSLNISSDYSGLFSFILIFISSVGDRNDATHAQTRFYLFLKLIGSILPG